MVSNIFNEAGFKFRQNQPIINPLTFLILSSINASISDLVMDFRESSTKIDPNAVRCCNSAVQYRKVDILIGFSMPQLNLHGI